MRDEGPTLLGIALMVGVVYFCDRTYRRWLRESHPLAEHRARMDRLRTGYRLKRAGLTDVVQVVADVLVDVARARSMGDVR